MDTRSTIQSLGVTSVSKRVDFNPSLLVEDTAHNRAYNDRYCSHWKVTLKHKGHQLTVPFSMGQAHGASPSLHNVVGCLISDSLSVEDVDFEDWAENLGFDADSKSAKKAYKACVRMRERLIDFFGDDAFNALCDADDL